MLNGLARNSLVKALASSAGEGVEEVISTAISPYLQRAIYDPSAENATAEELIQSALLGAAAGGVFQGLGAIARSAGIEPGGGISTVQSTPMSHPGHRRARRNRPVRRPRRGKIIPPPRGRRGAKIPIRNKKRIQSGTKARHLEILWPVLILRYLGSFKSGGVEEKAIWERSSKSSTLENWMQRH